MTTARHRGRIVDRNEARGYAFLDAPAADGVFLHATEYRGTWPPAVGARVTFDLRAGPRGLFAGDAAPLDD